MYEIEYYKRNYTPIFFVVDSLNIEFDDDILLEHHVSLAFDIKNNVLGYIEFDEELYDFYTDDCYKFEIEKERKRVTFYYNDDRYKIGSSIKIFKISKRALNRFYKDNTDIHPNELGYTGDEIVITEQIYNTISNNINELYTYFKLRYI